MELLVSLAALIKMFALLVLDRPRERRLAAGAIGLLVAGMLVVVPSNSARAASPIALTVTPVGLGAPDRVDLEGETYDDAKAALEARTALLTPAASLVVPIAGLPPLTSSAADVFFDDSSTSLSLHGPMDMFGNATGELWVVASWDDGTSTDPVVNVVLKFGSIQLSDLTPGWPADFPIALGPARIGLTNTDNLLEENGNIETDLLLDDSLPSTANEFDLEAGTLNMQATVSSGPLIEAAGDIGGATGGVRLTGALGTSLSLIDEAEPSPTTVGLDLKAEFEVTTPAGFPEWIELTSPWVIDISADSGGTFTARFTGGATVSPDGVTVDGTGSIGIAYEPGPPALTALDMSLDVGAVPNLFGQDWLELNGFCSGQQSPSSILVNLGGASLTVSLTPADNIICTNISDGDGDGISAEVEALAPNAGDGNADGTPDNQQSNVASLPGPTGSYVTLAAPAGTMLADVRTIDPTSLAPPPQLTLPEGLTGFTLNGLVPGDDVTLTIYSSSTAGVTGYAKYLAGVWSVLPSDRVEILGDRVEITLTDGGIGDDDGIANGVVVDPGGIVIQTAPLDTTPPTITGTASPAANAAGWHNTPVTIDWTATDPEPSTDTASDPADTIVTTDGADQLITSGPSCDAANNCATGTTTVSIDTALPVIDVVAPLEIRVDQALTMTCTASDALSGIATDCIGVTAPAGTLTVGTTVQYTFTATDLAGNTSTRQVAVTVLPPLNTAPTVRADMGVAGLETIGFQSAAVVLFGSFTDAENNGPYTAAVRWTATGNFVNTIVTGNGQFLTAWAYTGTSARTVTVRICDVAGACGTDTVTVRPNVTAKITPLAPCVADRGAGATGGRYEARWGYRNPAAFAIYVPTINTRENTFTSAPYRRGQPEVFLPGTNRDVFRTGFSSGTHTWRVNGTNATARSSTPRC